MGPGFRRDDINSFGIGQPVRRKEDRRLLTGRGCYVDDVAPSGLVYAVFLRSPHAHARIVSIDTRAALAAPGALAVLTAADYRADGLGPIPQLPGLLGIYFYDPNGIRLETEESGE